MKDKYASALIIGTGPGLGAALARRFTREGLDVAITGRDPARLERLASETGAVAIPGDAKSPDAVEAIFAAARRQVGEPDIVVYNASGFLPGAITALDPVAVKDCLETTAYGAFLVARAAAPGMIARGAGALLFTGATASVKGFARSSAFAMSKFALRGLAQSLARELAPQGIHVGHFVLDGEIASAATPETGDRPASKLDPDAIAETYWALLQQPRAAWTWEMEIRPWTEHF
jgi:NAD(P)-dependent dehydrogenase (short-subunit alcohol dehydrogenase family)